MYYAIRIRLFSRQIAHLEKLVELLDGALPGIPRLLDGPHIRFVPHDPAVDAPLISTDNVGHILSPQIIRIIIRQEKPIRDARRPLISVGPIGRVSQHADDFPTGSQLFVQRSIREIVNIPVIRAVRLQATPPKEHPLPPNTRFRGAFGIAKCFHRTETTINGWFLSDHLSDRTNTHKSNHK